MEREAHHSGVKIKSYRADNGIFKAGEFRLDMDKQNQQITYCGVGAHHQNGLAERYIRIMVERARTCLLNAHARNDVKIPMELWTFAMRHVTNQWNATPRRNLNWLTPDEVWNGIGRRLNKKTKHFKHFHPFGCPVYVLNEALQDGKKQPKWDPRSRVGIYLGRSRDHATDVAWILNPKTDRVSP